MMVIYIQWHVIWQVYSNGNDNAAKRDFLNLKRQTETSVWIVS